MSASLVYMTAGSAAEAREIGRTLVGERLAACVNVIEPMTSFYWWNGKIEEGHEAVLIAKTRTALVAALTERVKALHSYDCPCVVRIGIEAGNPDFLAWIDSETEMRAKEIGN